MSSSFFNDLDRPKMLFGMQALDGMVLLIAAIFWVFIHHFFLLAIFAGGLIAIRRGVKKTLPPFYLTGLCYLALPRWLFNELWRSCLPCSRKTLYIR